MKKYFFLDKEMLKILLLRTNVIILLVSHHWGINYFIIIHFQATWQLNFYVTIRFKKKYNTHFKTFNAALFMHK